MSDTPRLRRHDPSVIAEDVRRLLAEPLIGEAFDRYEQALVDELASRQHDGSDAFEDWERELCRTIRTIRRFRYGLNKVPQLDDLRNADFRAGT